MNRTIGLSVEFVLAFFVMPIVVVLARREGVRLPMIPLLWAFAAWCLWVMHRNGGIGWRAMFSQLPQPRQFAFILVRWAVVAAGLWLYIREVHPDYLFALPRHRPGLWMMVMILYPIFSVMPQSIIWRRFLFERYKSLFGSGLWMLLMAGVAFGFVHIVFVNVPALIATLGMGLLVAHTYMRTGSLPAAMIEHALYGCWAFTVGFGKFIYGGAVPVGA